METKRPLLLGSQCGLETDLDHKLKLEHFQIRTASRHRLGLGPSWSFHTSRGTGGSFPERSRSVPGAEAVGFLLTSESKQQLCRRAGRAQDV